MHLNLDFGNNEVHIQMHLDTDFSTNEVEGTDEINLKLEELKKQLSFDKIDTDEDVQITGGSGTKINSDHRQNNDRLPQPPSPSSLRSSH